MDSPAEPLRNTRCHRCGGRLGMGRSMLYRVAPGRANRSQEYLVSLLRGQLGQSDDAFCEACGAKSLSGRTRTSSQRGGGNPLERLLLRLGRMLRRPVTAARTRRKPYVDIQGRLDLARLLADAAFPVYGLKPGPHQLRLRGLRWGGGGRGRVIRNVGLTYAAEAPSEPRRAMELSQGGGVAASAEGRLMEDLHAVERVVRGYGPRESRQEYLRRGNIHRHWNLESIGRAPRRRVVVQIDGEPAKVELAYWWRPQLVVLARVVLGGNPVRAVSVGLTHVQLLPLLKTMVVLQHDPEALEEHRKGYEQAHGSRDKPGV